MLRWRGCVALCGVAWRGLSKANWKRRQGGTAAGLWPYSKDRRLFPTSPPRTDRNTLFIGPGCLGVLYSIGLEWVAKLRRGAARHGLLSAGCIMRRTHPITERRSARPAEQTMTRLVKCRPGCGWMGGAMNEPIKIATGSWVLFDSVNVTLNKVNVC